MKRRLRCGCATVIHGYGGREDGDENGVDRLSSLPDVLLINIFSFLDVKIAIQASILSKRWVKLWTLLPVLNFDSSSFTEKKNYSFDPCFEKVTFDNFVNHVLKCRNQSIKIDNLNIKATNLETMSRVLNFALMNCVSNVCIDTSEILHKYYPFKCNRSSGSLEGLKLKGMLHVGKFPFFVGLKTLILERVKIVEPEPFKGFPNLENLFLINCKLGPDFGVTDEMPYYCPVIRVVAHQLMRFTIKSCFYQPVPYDKIVLETPKLVLFELEGLIPMTFATYDLPNLETIYIDCCYSFGKVDERMKQPNEYEQKLNLISILRRLGSAKKVHLSNSTLKLLSYSADLLAEEVCPFTNLQLINLIPPPNKPLQIPVFVKTYLLKDSPNAVVSAVQR